MSIVYVYGLFLFISIKPMHTWNAYHICIWYTILWFCKCKGSFIAPLFCQIMNFWLNGHSSLIFVEFGEVIRILYNCVSNCKIPNIEHNIQRHSYSVSLKNQGERDKKIDRIACHCILIISSCILSGILSISNLGEDNHCFHPVVQNKCCSMYILYHDLL